MELCNTRLWESCSHLMSLVIGRWHPVAGKVTATRLINWTQQFNGNWLKYVVGFNVYIFCRLTYSCPSAAQPVSQTAADTYESANGHTTVTCQVSGFPVSQGTSKRPLGGLLLFCNYYYYHYYYWYWRRRAGVKQTMSLASGVRLWTKKQWNQATV